MGLWLTKVFEKNQRNKQANKQNNLSSKIQVASRELNMPLSNVHLRGTSTETVPNTNFSGGSVVADLNGLAIKVRIIAMVSKSLTPAGPIARVVLRCWEWIQLLLPFPHPFHENCPPPASSAHMPLYFSLIPDISLVG